MESFIGAGKFDGLDKVTQAQAWMESPRVNHVVDDHDEALMVNEGDECVYFTDDRKDSAVEIHCLLLNV